jgi:prevent-host-death family protein
MRRSCHAASVWRESVVAVTVRELAHRTRDVLREVERDRRKILVTSNGRPVAALVPIDADELFDRTLEGLVPSDADISREIASGSTKSVAEVARELGL